jgi:hypothetical protein
MAGFEAVKSLQEDDAKVPRGTRDALRQYYNPDESTDTDASRVRFALEAISTSDPDGPRGPFLNLGPTGRSKLRTATRKQTERRPTAGMKAFADRHIASWRSGA